MANTLENTTNNNTTVINNCDSNIVFIPVGMPATTVIQPSNISDVCGYLQPAVIEQSHGICPYDHIIDMMRGLDLQDDGIVMNHKIKSIEADFCNIVHNEDMLTDCMEYMNNIALTDGDTALKFALLFSSRNFDALAMNDTKVRYAMLKILETNFLNADFYRMKDKNLLYNSITMLGEYYHRVRLANNSPITILGKSLLKLLLQEVESPDSVISVKLAKLILSQITLNGDVMKVRHKTELTELLFHIRRNLIEQQMLKPITKALLLMTLDLYYSNFANLGPDLEEMYTKYLVLPEEEDEVEGVTEVSNNNLLHETSEPPQYQFENYHNELQPLDHESTDIVDLQHAEYQETDEGFNQNSVNCNNDNCPDEPYHIVPMAKKWSEQISEESYYEKELSNGQVNSETELNESAEGNECSQERDIRENCGETARNDYESYSSSNSRRSYKQCNSPRPLKQNYNIDNNNSEDNQEFVSGEERDQSKPLPRWRATRFNRENSEQQQQHNNRERQRRYSAGFDDDRSSVRSENGGGIRLYSINDRLKHSQEKLDRNNSSIFNSIANSNWDRQSQRDDRSERSYVSNYERGNQRRGNRQYNNRQMYDKPPRFQKNRHQQKKDGNSNGGHNSRIKSEAWRHSSRDENSSYTSNGPDSNSRSSSRARTLPRSGKSNRESATTNTSNSTASSHYRRSNQNSSSQYRNGQYNSRNEGNNRGRHNGQYNTQSSSTKESSSLSADCRPGDRNNRNFDKFSKLQSIEREPEDSTEVESSHQSDEEKTWKLEDNNELVHNARNTTKYMNYLSSKK